MSILYMINKSPFTSNAFECLLDTVTLQTAQGLSIAVLLIQDAVIVAKKGAGTDNHKFEDVLAPLLAQGTKFYALAPDLKSRAISEAIPGVKCISYEEWVDLLETFEKLMNIT